METVYTLATGPFVFRGSRIGAAHCLGPINGCLEGLLGPINGCLEGIFFSDELHQCGGFCARGAGDLGVVLAPHGCFGLLCDTLSGLSNCILGPGGC